MKRYTVLIIKNTLKDLSVFQFEKCKIINVHSKEFKDFLKETNSENEEFVLRMNEYISVEKTSMYAIMGVDYKTPTTMSVYETFNFLKILFPSVLEIDCIVTYIYNLELKFHYTFEIENDYYSTDYYLDYEDEKVSCINAFIKNNLNHLYSNNFIRNAGINYQNAYEASHLHFSFLAFCMLLESLVQGNNELIYRISRAVAILCGNNDENSRIIFQNMGKIYSLRSKIIHGEEFELEKVQEYLYYIECISSKIIIELLIHKIDIKTLNNKFTELGFGNQQNISENWYNFNYNQHIENTIIQVLKK